MAPRLSRADLRVTPKNENQGFRLSTAPKSRLHAVACAFVFLLCTLATIPVAEIGLNDDWSYVQTARILAQTGHIVYNGFATAMLGWQLYLGALFIKVFGPSFTSVRASTVLVGMATAFFVHRSLIRSGISITNASFGTLVLVVSPLFLPLSVTFMTDISGLFCIVFCYYACLRALQAANDRSVLAWLAVAALSNALGGTVRQIAWLGVLVLFPSAVWLLRRRRFVLPWGAALYAVSALVIFESMRWFARQPYSIGEPFLPQHIGLRTFAVSLHDYYNCLASLILFLLPLLIAFCFPRAFKKRRTLVLLAAAGLALFGALYVFLDHLHKASLLLFPYLGYTLSEAGMLDWLTALPVHRPPVLGYNFRVFLAVCTLVSAVCFFGFLIFGRPRADCDLQDEAPLTWNDMLILLVPFSVSYVGMLWPRASDYLAFDRYVLPLMFLGILFLLRLYQNRVGPNLPVASYAVALLFAAYAVAGTHDAFSLYRARVAAVDEVTRAGVPPNAIDAGFEYDGMLQIQRYGHVNNPKIRIPRNAFFRHASPFPADCEPESVESDPVLVPGYVVSFDSDKCGGPSGFAPVEYHQWLPPHRVNLYIVRVTHPAVARR